MSEWQPIETLPRDSKYVDLWCRHDTDGWEARFADCEWNYNEGGFWTYRDGYRLSNHHVTPTHWMRVAPPGKPAAPPSDDRTA